MKIAALIRVAIVALGVLAASSPASAQEDVYEDNDPTALVDFHATLDPYGSWAEDPTYGTVWVPNADVVGPDFVPYATGGHWAYGDDYTWISDYDWGWAPFHYGRWVYADDRGWSWIAGREYAPAWVDWRIGDPGGFVGWAPAPPSFFWRGGVAINVGFPVPPRFVYCGMADVFHPHLFERIVRGPQLDGIAVHMHPFEEHPWGGGRRFFGPAPGRIGIEPGRIVRFTGAEPGLVHAREFAHPSLAVRYGAHPPTRAGSFERPGQRPGEHPFERPGEHPVGRGVERPGERPMERPIEHPRDSAPAHGPEVKRQAAPAEAHGAAHGPAPSHAAPRHNGR